MSRRLDDMYTDRRIHRSASRSVHLSQGVRRTVRLKVAVSLTIQRPHSQAVAGLYSRGLSLRPEAAQAEGVAEAVACTDALAVFSGVKLCL